MVIRHWRWTLFINFYLTFLFKNLYFGFCGRGLIAASNSHPWLWKLKCHALMALGHQVTRHLPLLLPLLRSFANITFLWDSFGGRRWQGYPTKHVLCCSVTILLVLPGGDPYPQLTSVLWQPPFRLLRACKVLPGRNYTFTWVCPMASLRLEWSSPIIANNIFAFYFYPCYYC